MGGRWCAAYKARDQPPQLGCLSVVQSNSTSLSVPINAQVVNTAACGIAFSEVLRQTRCSSTISTYRSIYLATETETAKAQPQNVRAELSRILFEPKPKKYPAESLEPRKFVLRISQLFLIIVKQLRHKRTSCRSSSLTTPDRVVFYYR